MIENHNVLSRESVAARARRPRRIVRFLEKRGPIFIKIGQFLALRPDLIPQEHCDELLQLVDAVPPFPWAAADEILKRELGRPASEVFAHFNRRPIAAGSLAQVHLARLNDGTEVAVKIQRPDLEKAIERDLRRVRIIANLLEKSGSSFIVSPRALADEIEGWLKQEIDFRQELSNMERLYDLSKGAAFQRIPRPYPAYSTRRILTAEYLAGTPVSFLLKELRDHPSGAGREKALRGIVPELYAQRLLIGTLTQIFRHQFFHADLHPGNLMVLPGDVVGFVDFGLCDELAGSLRERQFQFFAAIYSGDQGRIFKSLTEVLIPGEATDLERFRLDYLQEARRLEEADSSQTGNAVDRSPLAQYLTGIMRAARRNQLQVPARVLSMYRVLLTVESLANQLGFTEGLRGVGTEFFEKLQREEMIQRLFDREGAERMLMSVMNLKRDAPGQLQQILAEVSQGNLTVKTDATESLKTARTRNQRTRLLVLAILTVGVSFLLGSQNPGTVFGLSLVWPLSAALIILYLSCFVLWRRL